MYVCIHRYTHIHYEFPCHTLPKGPQPLASLRRSSPCTVLAAGVAECRTPSPTEAPCTGRWPPSRRCASIATGLLSSQGVQKTWRDVCVCVCVCAGARACAVMNIQVEKPHHQTLRLFSRYPCKSAGASHPPYNTSYCATGFPNFSPTRKQGLLMAFSMRALFSTGGAESILQPKDVYHDKDMHQKGPIL